MRLLIACAFSAAVVLSSPFMGRLQSLLRSSLSTRAYILLLGVAVGAAILGAIVVAFVRIRQQRMRRLLIMAAACATGFLYTQVMSTGTPETDAVERVHFVEYGLIALLFYRVWRPSTSLGAALSSVEGRRAGDPSTLLLPVLCAFVVGTLDEWLQWFIPYRVGEMHDVWLNLTAIVCGVMFAVALEPPPSFTRRLGPDGRARTALAVAAVVLAVGGFVGVVHVGYDLQVDGIGRFKSRHTVAELDVLQRDRSTRWVSEPPIGIRRLSREDQYLDEALWHVRERNRRWDAGDVSGSWQENLILERFFTPVLDIPTYASPTGTRWPPDHRADAQARADATRAFVSAAEAYPIYAWSKPIYWSLIAGTAGLLVVTAVVSGIRRALRTDRSR